jgi:hypothetical protein
MVGQPWQRSYFSLSKIAACDAAVTEMSPFQNLPGRVTDIHDAYRRTEGLSGCGRRRTSQPGRPQDRQIDAATGTTSGQLALDDHRGNRTDAKSLGARGYLDVSHVVNDHLAEGQAARLMTSIASWQVAHPALNTSIFRLPAISLVPSILALPRLNDSRWQRDGTR